VAPKGAHLWQGGTTDVWGGSCPKLPPLDPPLGPDNIPLEFFLLSQEIRMQKLSSKFRYRSC